MLLRSKRSHIPRALDRGWPDYDGQAEGECNRRVASPHQSDRAYLGLVNYYRRFITGYSRKAAPLTVEESLGIGRTSEGHPVAYEGRKLNETERCGPRERDDNSGALPEDMEALLRSSELPFAKYKGPSLRGEGLEKDPFLVARLVQQAKSRATSRFWIKDGLLITRGIASTCPRLETSLKEGDIKRVP
ncbi:hypothetical protein AMTR_s00003p00173380 [Amborella trichopoda]|uniref:Uncharacterized protein n=1 Tax=Amborella trichopoda TaxID=13333 RepID=W1P6M4_AMBTC|nr:hypothetical protein AMTR_s00003p00173380 [Amborella trichopoda]